jgi:hypothetical protein
MIVDRHENPDLWHENMMKPKKMSLEEQFEIKKELESDQFQDYMKHKYVDPVGRRKLTPRYGKGKKNRNRNKKLAKIIEEKEKSRPRVSNKGPKIYPYLENEKMNYSLTQDEIFQNWKNDKIYK